MRVKSGVTPANQTKERSVHEFFTGAFRNKSSMWIVLVFLRKNTRIHKMSEIHELFVLALSLVWFARATSDFSMGGLIEVKGGYQNLVPPKTRTTVLQSIVYRPFVQVLKNWSLKFRKARLFIILCVRNIGRVCLQFWWSVCDSVWRPFHTNSTGNPHLAGWEGGFKGTKNVNKHLVNKSAFPRNSTSTPSILYSKTLHTPSHFISRAIP